MRYVKKPKLTLILEDDDERIEQAEVEALLRAHRPPGMDKPLAAEWERVARQMAQVGRLRPIFSDAIFDYAVCMVALGEVRAALAANSGPRLPLLRRENELLRRRHSLSAALGMPPQDARKTAKATSASEQYFR